MAARDFEICIDAIDPERLRPFWRAALGYVDQPAAESGIDLADPAGVRPAIWFQRVPEPKAAKNRVHLDIQAEPGEHEHLVAKLVALGGTVLAEHPRFTTLADPEGNELCINRH
jgi:4a-hydroxytetrahydrobiopterin dehydratase